MERWCGKVAVVTGASAGIGEALVISLVEAGVIVAGFARRSERVEALSKKLIGKKGKLYSVKCDVMKEEDIFKSFRWVTSNLGPVHILVNNAGILRPTNLIDGNIDDWKKIIDTNFLGLCICTREAVKSMQRNSIAGHVVHINSITGHFVPPVPQWNVYPATKHAVTALTETLRLELAKMGSKIKVTSISPGVTATEIFTINNMDIAKNFDEYARIESVDIADAIMYALGTPPNVNVQELTIRPVAEQF